MENVIETVRRPHVIHTSGNEEWYTPPEIIEVARRVMGDIDLDPASSATANEIVRARRFYSHSDDGLNLRRVVLDSLEHKPNCPLPHFR